MTTEGWGNVPAEVNAEVNAGESKEAFNARRDAELLEWRSLKEQAAFYTAQEKEARAKVTATLFPQATKGTQRYELGHGYKVKLVYGFTYTLGNKDLVDPATNEKIPVNKQVEELENAIAQLGNEGPFLADRLIKWKPELVEREYLALDKENPTHMEAKELIDAILTVKPASPQLTLEEPKAQ